MEELLINNPLKLEQRFHVICNNPLLNKLIQRKKK